MRVPFLVTNCLIGIYATDNRMDRQRSERKGLHHPGTGRLRREKVSLLFIHSSINHSLFPNFLGIASKTTDLNLHCHEDSSILKILIIMAESRNAI